MKRLEAEVLRPLVINQYIKTGLADKVTNMLAEKCDISDMEDWALSVDELMQLPLDNVPVQFMAQIEKLAKLLGCSTKDAQSIAVSAFGGIKTANQ